MGKIMQCRVVKILGSKILKLATLNHQDDLIFTKTEEMDEGVSHECPLGRTSMSYWRWNLWKNVNIKKRLIRRKWELCNGKLHRTFCRGEDWLDWYEEEFQYSREIWLFMNICHRGIERCVPFYTVKSKGEKTWFGWRCKTTRRNWSKAWRNSKKTPNKNNRDKYREARYEYMKIRREDEFERIVCKCKESSIFCKFINRKLKRTERERKGWRKRCILWKWKWNCRNVI